MHDSSLVVAGFAARPGSAEQYRLGGCVQGIGLRPAIARWALQCALAGQVRNTSDGVEIVVEGDATNLQAFASMLAQGLPAGAKIVNQHSSAARGLDGFEILESAETGPLVARVPLDTAVCAECLSEVFNPWNRRFEYAFTNCAVCGPRYAILAAMPYARRQTSMRHFPLCLDCAAEFCAPHDRRFHADTIACPDCGPQVWLASSAGAASAKGSQAVSAAAAALKSGQVVALRGVGGYQLVVDATNEKAVEQLRIRKHRPTKPLAVMVATLADAESLAAVNQEERSALVSPANPIVVLERRPDTILAPGVAGAFRTLGVFLPTTALHAALMHAVARPLVVTSGNSEGNPLSYEVADAEAALSGIADLWLHHDRPIVAPIDDSVVRVIAGRAVTLRLGRGMAPLSLAIPWNAETLATGGHQKSAIALCNGAQTILGPHVGDLETLSSRERYNEQLEHLGRLYGTRPEAIAHDLHPDYFTTQWSQSRGVRCLPVQHHHAHIVSAMIEHEWLDREVLGVAFDGTGYGTDGTIWGGEFLRTRISDFERSGHLLPFRLLGGERAAREPWRVAVELVSAAVGDKAATELRFTDIDRKASGQLLRLAATAATWPRTTSAGRLFDGVAAIALGIAQTTFEGEAAMRLESACDREATGAYSFLLDDRTPLVVDWRSMIRELCGDHRVGVAPATMAMRFHRGLADAICRACQQLGELPVVLTGGVFQNRVLVELIQDQWSGKNPLGLPGRIPPGDGGLAAGQLAIALARHHTDRGVSCV